MPLLEARGLKKVYGKRCVVDNVNFDVEPGEIVGLLGPNGAGKTTSFRITMGMIAPLAGAVYFNGEDVTHMPMYQRARRGMGYLPQEASAFRRLTVEENLLAILETMKMTRKQRRSRSRALLAELELTHKAHQKAYTLSGGERRRLEITRALVTNPSLLLLDEPFSGIDPIAVQEIQEIIKSLRDKGIGVLLTDHSVRETLAITDRSYILNEGKVFRSGTSEELVTDEDVRRVYLGDTFRADEFLAAPHVSDRRRDDARPIAYEDHVFADEPPIAPGKPAGDTEVREIDEDLERHRKIRDDDEDPTANRRDTEEGDGV